MGRSNLQFGGSKERLFEAIESAANVAELELPEPVEGLKDIRMKIPGYESDSSNSLALPRALGDRSSQALSHANTTLPVIRSGHQKHFTL